MIKKHAKSKKYYRPRVKPKSPIDRILPWILILSLQAGLILVGNTLTNLTVGAIAIVVYLLGRFRLLRHFPMFLIVLMIVQCASFLPGIRNSIYELEGRPINFEVMLDRQTAWAADRTREVSELENQVESLKITSNKISEEISVKGKEFKMLDQRLQLLKEALSVGEDKARKLAQVMKETSLIETIVSLLSGIAIGVITTLVSSLILQWVQACKTRMNIERESKK